jgi:hypothetical protein
MGSPETEAICAEIPFIEACAFQSLPLVVQYCIYFEEWAKIIELLVDFPVGAEVGSPKQRIPLLAVHIIYCRPPQPHPPISRECGGFDDFGTVEVERDGQLQSTQASSRRWPCVDHRNAQFPVPATLLQWFKLLDINPDPGEAQCDQHIAKSFERIEALSTVMTFSADCIY